MAHNRCKEQLIETATDLFSRNGFHATGIDKIIEEASVSRMSLYNNFASKDALIETVLARQDEAIEQWTTAVICGNGTPEERFDRLFDELGNRWNSDCFHGCPFINAVAEYSQPEHPVHQAARRHKLRMTTLVAKLLVEMQIRDFATVAEQVMLVIDGGAVRAQIFGDGTAHEVAKSAAKILLKAARAVG